MLLRAISRGFVLIMLASGLAGCAQGRDFIRPDLVADFELGRTTQTEVVERYGPPLAQTLEVSGSMAGLAGAVPRNQVALLYAYTQVTKVGPTGARAIRLAIFGFKDSVLRTLIYGSSFPADQREFDPAVVEGLLKQPALTRADLVARLGPPEGRVSDPSAPYAERDAWYVFDHRNDGRPGGAQVAVSKSFTADIAKDGRVIAHKLDVTNPP